MFGRLISREPDLSVCCAHDNVPGSLHDDELKIIILQLKKTAADTW